MHLSKFFVPLLIATSCTGSISDYDPDDEEDVPQLGDDGGKGGESVIADLVTTGACKNHIGFDSELVIRARSVVDDPRAQGMGVWSFGHLATELAGTRGPEAMIKEWLRGWETTQTIAGELIAGNAGKVDDVVLTPWQNDGFAMAKVPFRLSAITLRADLPSGNELRFVFGGKAANGAASPFNVAFEYHVSDAFVKLWHDTLHQHALGSAGYNDALAALTEQGIHSATGVNGSSLAQLRTNEVAIDTPWDLREFHLTSTAGGTLALAPIKGVPQLRFMGKDAMRNGVTAAMETRMARVPSRDFFWTAPVPSSFSGRHAFAMSTCNGCHSRETNTNFVHIKPREAGKVAAISDFLGSRVCVAGDTTCKPYKVKDPVSGDVRELHTVNDREAALNKILAAAGDCEP